MHRLPEMLGNIPVSASFSQKEEPDCIYFLHAVKHHYEEDVQATGPVKIQFCMQHCQTIMQSHNGDREIV